MIPFLLQPASALPADTAALLSPAEVATYAALKLPKRRADWLLGRITAKQLVAAHLGIEGLRLDEIEIIAAPDGAPFATLHGAPLPLSLSISHSHATAFCALVAQVGAAAGATVGADIEYTEARDPSFLSDYFTLAEQAVAQAWAQPDVAATLLWSAKEALLKALREGLRIDTRQVQIALPAALDDDWEPYGITLHPDLAARFPGAYTGWARQEGDFVLTLALRTAIPNLLQAAGPHP